MLAAIPYTTFPDLPFGLNTFGLMVAAGVLIGAWVGASYAERFGIDRDETYRVGTIMVLVGIVGSRLTWVLTHLDQIDSPIDVIAIWEGGIQFSGGFIAGLAVGVPMMMKWDRLQRWNVLNGYAMGLAVGVAFGRIGCYAVGEHFGRETDFFLGTRYEGDAATLLDDVREPTLGDGGPSIVGLTFHNTSLYEMIHMFALFGLMGFLYWRARRAGREIAPGTFVGLFFVWYGVLRFLTDTLRVNDERVLMMTGAQWMSLVLVPFGLFVLFYLRPRLIRAAEQTKAAPGTAAGLLTDDDGEKADQVVVPDEVEAPDDADTQAEDAGSVEGAALDDPAAVDDAEGAGDTVTDEDAGEDGDKSAEGEEPVPADEAANDEGEAAGEGEGARTS